MSTDLHVVAGRTEPLEQEDSERRSVDSHERHQGPGGRVERFCKNASAGRQAAGAVRQQVKWPGSEEHNTLKMGHRMRHAALSN